MTAQKLYSVCVCVRSRTLTIPLISLYCSPWLEFDLEFFFFK